MSITALASKLYTIKSRKNVPLTSAFGTMVREDLAMRLSVYNLVRIVTRSEFLATVAQAKYGKRTPLEREEEAREKKKVAADAKFRQFTAVSIANLNNRINGLVAITERNTALIANLYGELGAYRNKNMPTLSSLSSIKDPSAVRLPIRNKTIKAQIDMMQNELAGLAANNKPFIKKIKPEAKKQKEKQKEKKDLSDVVLKSILTGAGLRAISSALLPLLAIGTVNAGILAARRETQRILGVPEDEIEGSNPLNQKTDRGMAAVGAVAGGYLAYKLKNILKKFKAPAVKVPAPAPAPVLASPTPTTSTTTTSTKAGRYWDGKMWRTVGGPKPTPAPITPTPTTPTVPAPTPTPAATTKPQMPDNVKWNAKAQRWQNTVTGRFVKAPKAPISSMRGPGTTAGTITKQNLPSSQPGNLFRRLPPGLARVLGGAGKILGTGPQTVALLMQGASEMASGRAGEAELARQQAKVAKFGIKFLRGEDGTPIYEINGKQYTSENLPPEYQVILNAYVGDERSASAREAKMKIAENPGLYNSLIVQGPPPATEPTSGIAAAVIAAAKATKLTVPEPQIMAAGAPQVRSPMSVDLGTIPSVSYAPGETPKVETVKDIIINASKIVGVDPAIMLAMAKQESNFNPNAAPPINKKTGKPFSSAKGLFQFVNTTWDEMLTKYSKDYPELLKGPFDPLASSLAGALYLKQNSVTLKKNKIPITGTSMYATHFLGSEGARRLFSAPKTALAVDVFKKESQANPSVFKNKDGSSKTIQDVIDFLYKKVGKQADVYSAQLKAASPPAMMAAAPNAVVAPPPNIPPSEASPAPAVEAQINATAALTAASMVQKQMNVVAEQVIKERKYNQPDDATVVNLDMQNYGLA